MSQWYLLKQLNHYLGKKRVPGEVMRKICHILYSKELGEDGYVVLCLDRITDDFYGIEEAVGMYPNKLELNKIAARWPARAVAQFCFSNN